MEVVAAGDKWMRALVSARSISRAHCCGGATCLPSSFVGFAFLTTEKGFGFSEASFLGV